MAVSAISISIVLRGVDVVPRARHGSWVEVHPWHCQIDSAREKRGICLLWHTLQWGCLGISTSTILGLREDIVYTGQAVTGNNQS